MGSSCHSGGERGARNEYGLVFLVFHKTNLLKKALGVSERVHCVGERAEKYNVEDPFCPSYRLLKCQ